MSADVVCMSLANVPPGEQRSRFLAVGLADNTVRIISLDPSVRTEAAALLLPTGASGTVAEGLLIGRGGGMAGISRSIWQQSCEGTMLDS